MSQRTDFTMDPDRDNECETCAVVAPLAEFASNRPGSRPVWQCEFCASTHLGNLIRQGGSQSTLAHGIVEALHIIRNELKEKQA